MAKPKVFFDANILLYTDDARYPEHQRIALDLIGEHLRRGTGAVSMQVLQEYAFNASRKLAVSPSLVRQKIEVFARFHVMYPRVEDIQAALDLHHRHQLSFWDSMIVRMASLSGAGILFTEDLQFGRRFDNLEIVNPFL